jgi:hypothetical protein
MSTATVVLLVLVASLVVSALIALALVRAGRARAQVHLREVPGDVRRSTAATSLGLTSLGVGELRGTGTLVLTDDEVAFAQWRPDRLVRIPRAAVVEVDTTRTHLGKTMNKDLLRIRWTNAETDVEDTVAFFLRDLDAWLTDLGGRRSAPAEEGGSGP